MVRRTITAAVRSADKAQRLIRNALKAGALLTSTELDNYVRTIRHGGKRHSSYSSSSKKRGDPPQSRAMVLYKKPSTGSKRVRNIVNRYTYAGKFRKPRAKKVMPMCISGKYENVGTQGAHQCVYIGHNALPFATVVKFLGLGIVNFYMKACRVAGSLITETIGSTVGSTGTARLEFSVSARGHGPTAEGIFSNSVQALVTDTWEAFAIDISNLLIQVFRSYGERSATVLFLRNYIVPFRFAIAHMNGGSGTSSLPTKIINFDDLFVTISGESNLQVQNRTPNESKGANADDIHVIDANPLRGKMYERSGSQFEMKNTSEPTAGVGSSTVLYGSKDFGVIFAGDRTGAAAGATNFGVMEQYMKKPPRPDFWRGCKKTSYIHIQPGQIKMSRVKATITKSLTGWAKWLTRNLLYFNDIDQPATIGSTTVASLPVIVPDMRFSQVRMMALEKMVDTTAPGNGDQVQVGYEVALLMKVSS